MATKTTLVDACGVASGGGSVKAMGVGGGRLRADASWPLGTVRMSERFLPGDDAGSKALKALRKNVAAAVREADWLVGAGGRLVGIGGTIRNLAAAAERHAGLDHPDAQGYLLTRVALDELISELASLRVSDRGKVPGIKPDRGDVILGGAVVLDAIMGKGGFAPPQGTA